MESILAAWRSVGLDGLRSTLDAQALEIAEKRESSAASHKELVVATKAFFKAGDAERLAGEKKILKAYQAEVDALTKRAKYSERAFTALYAKVHEAPDPVPHPEAAAEMEPELARLREENDGLQDDLLRYRLDVKEIKQVQFATLDTAPGSASRSFPVRSHFRRRPPMRSIKAVLSPS